MAAIGKGAVRVVAGAFAFTLGAAAGLLGAFVHAGEVVVGGVGLPVGLLLSLGLEVGALALAVGLADRSGVWLAGSGWIAVVLLLTWPRSEGDIVVPGTWYGYAFLAGGLVIAVAGAFAVAARNIASAPSSASDAETARR